ncbi:MAG: c-type cytochrome [Rudaea sp.]
MRSELNIGIVATAVVVAWLLASSAKVLALDTSQTPDAAIVAAEAWAFPVYPPPSDPHAAKPDPHKAVHVPGSTRSYTLGQLDDSVPDWFPQDHPLPPQIVSMGRKPALPCGECHTVSGQGVPATASPTGLPKAYILEQVAAFRAGERGGSPPQTTQDMADEAHNLADADLRQAADYFSGMKYTSRVKVVETAAVPKTHWKYFVLVPDENGAREPIGARIIESPDNFREYEYNDSRATYVAYVPPGSIARGATLAKKGIGAVPACVSCHGTNLQGVGLIPPLAGRSPTYLARQLILFRTGQRRGTVAMPMQKEVAALSVRDMIDAAAYAASLTP